MSNETVKKVMELEAEGHQGNHGWATLAVELDAEYDMFQFEKFFCTWQQQAILLTEVTYADTFTYVTPTGVFTDIGTLARALQNLFGKGWEIHVCFLGTELSFSIDKGISNIRHSFICTYIELDQASSQMHCDGWKFEKESNDQELDKFEGT